MKISVQMVIMSHLSDAQELLAIGVEQKIIQNKINFIKHLLLKYPDTSVELTTKEFDEEWKEVNKVNVEKMLIKTIDGDVLLAKIVNVAFCICATILIMIIAYNRWSKYGEYTFIDFLFSLFVHGGFMLLVYIGINYVINSWKKKKNNNEKI